MPRQTCRSPLPFLVMLLALLLGAQASAQSPNVLIVYVDDLGYGDTGAYGHPVIRTPNIDDLAARGTRFTHFYAPSALCSPSRAGLLTGRTPYRTGVESWIPDGSDVSLGRNETTIAALMKPLGYRTAVIGKWHLNGGLEMTDAPQPRDFGFDHQYGLAAWVKNEAVAAERDEGAPRSGRMYPDNMYRDNVPVGPTDRFSAELVTDEALVWLAEDDEAPFFLLLTYSEVHTPIASPPEYLAMYDEWRTPESRAHPDTYYFDYAGRPYRGRGEYYANTSYMDAQLGRVLDWLEARGLRDDTLVIFSSDNGPITAEAETPWEIGMAGETDGLRGRKRYLFEGGIRVPGIVVWPGHVPAGRVEATPATALDVLPTLAALVGFELPDDRDLDGQSLAPLLDADPATTLERDGVLYWSIPTPDGMEYALRDGDWKLILDPEGTPAYLFDLATDRYEVINLIEREPARLALLLDKYRAMRASIEGDPVRAEGLRLRAAVRG